MWRRQGADRQLVSLTSLAHHLIQIPARADATVSNPCTTTVLGHINRRSAIAEDAATATEYHHFAQHGGDAARIGAGHRVRMCGDLFRHSRFRYQIRTSPRLRPQDVPVVAALRTTRRTLIEAARVSRLSSSHIRNSCNNDLHLSRSYEPVSGWNTNLDT